MILFPVGVTIALTGIVHFSNNIFKLVLVRKKFNKEVVLSFGNPTVIFAFIGTVAISSFLDFTRLGVYSIRIMNLDLKENLSLLKCATLAAMTGAFIGNKLFKKVTLKFL